MGMNIKPGGGAAWQFDNDGDQVVGKIVSLVEQQQTHPPNTPLAGKPKTFDNGDPMMQYRVTLQTEYRNHEGLDTSAAGIMRDTGQRDVYLRGSQKPYADGSI